MIFLNCAHRTSIYIRASSRIFQPSELWSIPEIEAPEHSSQLANSLHQRSLDDSYSPPYSENITTDISELLPRLTAPVRSSLCRRVAPGLPSWASTRRPTDASGLQSGVVVGKIPRLRRLNRRRGARFAVCSRIKRTLWEHLVRDK